MLKEQIIEILKENPIDFSLYYYHKGHDIILNGADEIKSELEYWIGYEALVEYFVGQDIYYDFSGSFVLENEELILYVRFSGPYLEEFEPIELPVQSLFEDLEITSAIENIIECEIDFSNIFIQFCYVKNQGFSSFELEYVIDSEVRIDLKASLNKEIVTEIMEDIESYVVINAPELRLPKDIDQYYTAEYEGGSINYNIDSSEMRIKFDDVQLS